ncbi:MAG: CusA/CzcA family heavy metal efflux RND transporter [Chitinophagaceae bacterium]|nr:CusA/CzcA family heavy metal efflux RND transporter [Chitinophagaceae bacterium]
MLNNIIAFSIKQKLIIGLLVIGLIGVGIYQVTKLPIDAVPDITNNQVQVITITPSLGAPDVERLITFPIEQVNTNIPGLKEIRSFSRFGLSVVTIVFDDAIDIYWARQQVNERLQKAKEQIPKDVGAPELAPVSTGLGEIYQYTVRPKKGYEQKYSAMDLRTIQDWYIRRQLLGVEGVAEVSSFGGLVKQYEIAVDPAKLLANNITINDVFTALENNNQNTGGAYIEKGPTVLFIRSEGLVKHQEDIENIVVKNLSNGTPLLIKDIANIGFGSATRYGALTYNGTSQVSGAVVLMLKGANSNIVIKNIKERIKKIEKTLPEGVMIDPFLDRTKMVNNSITTVTKNLFEGALIVVFVLVLFLGNYRAGFIVASVIPLSMLFAITLMNLFGVSGNLMSLGALDFGLIVDGAVIIVEAVMHKLTHQRKNNNKLHFTQHEMDTEVKQASSKMMSSAVFGQIIILIVYLPILTLQGIEGKMFKPMAQTVAFALIGAFILSLTYIPMMSALFLSKQKTYKESLSDKFIPKIQSFYSRNLNKALQIPKTIIGAALLLFTTSIFILFQLGGEFLPSLPEGDYAVETRVLPGSNLNTSIDAVSKASKIILSKFPEVEKVIGKTGSSEVPTDPMPLEATDMMIILKDRSEWTSASTYEELEEKMMNELEAVPGVTFGFQYPVAMRFNELISGARQDVVCKIFGENLDTLSKYAQRLGNICNTVKGSSALYVESVTGMPQIVISYNRSNLSQYGLNIAAINKTINTAFAGNVCGTIYEDEKRFDVVVRLLKDKRSNLEDVQNLLISTAQGTQIPLSNVATVELIEGPSQIQREQAQRRIIVGFNARGRDVQSIVNELEEKVNHQIKLPPGYYITYGGAFENLETAKKRLSIAVPVSLMLIFIMLYFAFNSIQQSLLIFTAIPLSAIGGIIALALRGMPFSISAGIGFIALFGVAVLNGIVLLAEFNALKKENIFSLKEVVIKGTANRLRPVLMTALVASLGFLPMALSNGEGAEVQRPLATVVIGGLLVATLLTLFVLPILYIMFQKSLSTKITNPVKSLLICIVILGNNNLSIAQQPITLKAALDTALKNNLHLKNERLKSIYHEKLIATAKNIPSTNVSTELGQFNSFFIDSKIGIAQTLSLPKVYNGQKSLLTEEFKSSVLEVGLKEQQLKQQLTQIFYELLFLKEKKKVLLQQDSLYLEFLRVASLRFDKGETNILEKATAENQKSQIALQLLQLQQDYELLQLQFHLLLNSTSEFVPVEPSLKLNIEYSEEKLIANHPLLQYLKQQQQVALAQTQMEQLKLLPEITLGYNIMSMRGTGADDKVYNSTPKFQSIQIGLGIPIFNTAQKAKINAFKLNETIVNNEYEAQQKQIDIQFKSNLATYQKQLKIVSYMETHSLNIANTITKTATKQFTSGDINYLEWIQLMNQSVTIQNDYLEAIKNLNTTIIQINTFINK